MEQISYQRIRDYISCPLRYKFVHVEKVKPAFTSAGLAFGSAMHRVIAKAIVNKTATPEAVWEHEWKTENESEIRVVFKKDDYQDLLEKGKQLISLYLQQPHKILAINKDFKFRISDSVPAITGRIDLVENTSDGPVVVDLKTSSRKPGGFNGDDLGLTLYSQAAISSGLVKDEPDVTARLDVLTKTKTPQIHQVHKTVTLLDRLRLKYTLEQVYSGIEYCVFYPRQNCLCINCGYGKLCSHWY